MKVKLCIYSNCKVILSAVTGKLNISSEESLNEELTFTIEKPDADDNKDIKLKIAKGEEIFIDTDIEKMGDPCSFSDLQQQILVFFAGRIFEVMEKATEISSLKGYAKEEMYEFGEAEYQKLKLACS